MSDPTPREPAELGLADGLVLLSELVQAVFARAAAGLGLPPLQARLLGLLRGRRPTMAELARLLGLDSSSATGLVDRTQRRGLVARARLPEDRRCYRVELTEEGRRIARAFVDSVTAELNRLASGLTRVDRERLAHLVSAVVTANASAHGIDLTAELTRARPSGA